MIRNLAVEIERPDIDPEVDSLDIPVVDLDLEVDKQDNHVREESPAEDDQLLQNLVVVESNLTFQKSKPNELEQVFVFEVELFDIEVSLVVADREQRALDPLVQAAISSEAAHLLAL